MYCKKQLIKNMKYKVKDLLNGKNLISNLFLECIDSETVDSITKTKDYNVESTEVDIKLLVNDRELDIDGFLQYLNDQYFNMVKKSADSLVRKTLSNRAQEIGEMLSGLENKLKHIENSIEWDEKLIDINL